MTKPPLASTTEKDSDSDSESKPEKVVMKPSLAATKEKDSESDSEYESEKVVMKPSLAATTEKDPESYSESEPEKVVTLAATTRSHSPESDKGGVSMNRVKVVSVERKPYFQRLWTEDDEILVLQGDDPTYVKARDHKAFDLSKLV
ncbi:PREDICTED: probable transcription factor At1g11510 [Camelina sativa]|uniref:Probable transcription factor At1g11510 n=1 Tax=Camelina sativa TaxID=90675 RepID=A0ABM1RBW0_CAMSA|nr:PREDICTED: probable transcription factor At1g11510 [Camelina sativa]